jgi:hypothetical protein
VKPAGRHDSAAALTKVNNFFIVVVANEYDVTVAVTVLKIGMFRSLRTISSCDETISGVDSSLFCDLIDGTESIASKVVSKLESN